MSKHPLPTGHCTFLAVGLLKKLRVHWAYRVPRVRPMTDLGSISTPVGISSLCCWRLRINNQPTYLFGSGVSACFHLLCITKPMMIHCRYPYQPPLCSYTKFRLSVYRAFVPCFPLLLLLTGNVGRVSDSFT